MGGRGGTSGASSSGKATAGNVYTLAHQKLKSLGYDRYDKLPYEDEIGSLSTRKKFYKFSETVSSGGTPTTKYSKSTLETFSKINDLKLASNLKQSWSMGVTDKEAAKNYNQALKSHATIKQAIFSKQTPSKSTKSTTQSTKKTKSTQSKKFVNSDGEATKREITSTTYERAQKRLKKNLDSWFGFNTR